MGVHRTFWHDYFLSWKDTVSPMFLQLIKALLLPRGWLCRLNVLPRKRLSPSESHWAQQRYIQQKEVRLMHSKSFSMEGSALCRPGESDFHSKRDIFPEVKVEWEVKVAGRVQVSSKFHLILSRKIFSLITVCFALFVFIWQCRVQGKSHPTASNDPNTVCCSRAIPGTQFHPFLMHKVWRNSDAI